MSRDARAATFVVVAVLVGALAACPAAPVADTDAGPDEPDVPAADFGYVFVVDEPAFGYSTAGAVFRRGHPRAYDCSATEVAGCVLLECGAELDAAPVNAGAIDVVGADTPIALRFVDGAYTSVDQLPLFGGGEALTATNEGDEGVAFSLQVQAPQVVTITAPAWPVGSDVLGVTRADGLRVEWSMPSVAPQASGDVVVVVNTTDLSTELRCAFPAAVDDTGAGAADVPAEALLALPATDGFLDIELTDTDFVRVETWAIQLRATTHALVGDGAAAVASIELD